MASFLAIGDGPTDIRMLLSLPFCCWYIYRLLYSSLSCKLLKSSGGDSYLNKTSFYFSLRVVGVRGFSSLSLHLFHEKYSKKEVLELCLLVQRFKNFYQLKPLMEVTYETLLEGPNLMKPQQLFTIKTLDIIQSRFTA